jgi:hypothetical protein
MWLKLSWRQCYRGAGWSGLGGEPTSLPQILSFCHMERYSHGGLDLVGYKVGPAGQRVGRPATLLGPPGRGFDLQGPHGKGLTVVTLV